MTIRDEVRARYAKAASAVSEGWGACCTGEACGPEPEPFGSGLYDAEQRASLPAAAIEASLGCGNPLLVAELREGETVLDLGSGGGIDVLLSARRVGPGGRAYGLDMTDEMLNLARRNAAEAGVSNVEFLKGHIEEIPLPDASVDVIISNCVINLSGDKPAVFAQMFRVLRPGGRVGVSDVVAEDRLSPDERAQRGDWVRHALGDRARGQAGLSRAARAGRRAMVTPGRATVAWTCARTGSTSPAADPTGPWPARVLRRTPSWRG